MKMRKGWRVFDADGYPWDGDCAKWAADARKMGRRVISLRIIGGTKWPCGACALGIGH